MYRHQEERSVEAVCYEQKHIEKVLDIIKTKFPEYFNDFIMLEAGYGVSEQDVQKIAEKLGVQKVTSKKNVDITKKFKNLLDFLWIIAASTQSLIGHSGRLV